jgi:hypothetical protein
VIKRHFCIELRPVARDQAGLLQRPHAAQARGGGQANPVSQILVVDASISLQDFKNMLIQSVQCHE